MRELLKLRGWIDTATRGERRDLERAAKSTPATSAPRAASARAMSTTPRFQPPSPEMKSTTLRGAPVGRYTVIGPNSGYSNVVAAGVALAGSVGFAAANALALHTPRTHSSESNVDLKFMESLIAGALAARNPCRLDEVRRGPESHRPRAPVAAAQPRRRARTQYARRRRSGASHRAEFPAARAHRARRDTADATQARTWTCSDVDLRSCRSLSATRDQVE